MRVLDFGIAKFQEAADGAKTSTGAVLGSAYYMAPEQVQAEAEIDARADVWAVGATVYELLVGEPAHMAPTHAAVIAKIVMRPAPPVSGRRTGADAKLDAIVARALMIDPAERFASAAEMREAIGTYLVERAATVRSVPPPPLTPSMNARRVTSKDTSSVLTPRALVAGTTDLSPLPGGASGATRAKSLVPVALAAFAIGVLGIAAVATRTSSPPPSPRAESLAALLPPVPASVPPTPSPSPSPSPTPLPTASASASAPPAPSTTTRRLPAPPPSAARPTPCAPGEVLADGHCCVRGFVWRDDHCERDISLTAPF